LLSLSWDLLAGGLKTAVNMFTQSLVLIVMQDNVRQFLFHFPDLVFIFVVKVDSSGVALYC